MNRDPAPAQASIAIARVTAADTDVRDLIAALDRDLARHYTPEQQHGLKLDALFEPPMRFFLARLNGAAIGCGGVALFADFAEIKRMYVRPDARGRGVADALMARLAQEAADAGLTLLRLETGTEQKAAMRFYRRAGFMPCNAFEPYSSMPPSAIATSVFMERRI
jgi:putative acetyltransferase